MNRLILSLALAASCLPAAQAEGTLAIVGGRIIDGTGTAPIIDGIVLVEDDTIIAVGPDVEVPTGATIIDADGMTVMPGLIDVHVHYDIVGHSDYDHWFATYENRMRTDIFPAAGSAMLTAGVTSVRDLGSDFENILWLKDQINAGAIEAPRTFIAGPFLRKTLTAYVSETYKDTWAVESPEDGRAKVRQLAEMGVDLIKTQDEELSQDELAAIYDEAHKLGLRAASHIYSPDGVRTALQAGLGEYDTIEHIGDGTDAAYAPDIVAMILAQRVAMAPTIIALEGVQMIVDNPERTDDPRWSRYLPEDIYADIRSSYREVDLSQHSIFQRAEEDRAGRNAKLKQLAIAGAIFAISSDSGTRGNPHHNAMWQEMVLTAEATGMTPMQVIVAATQTNANVLGRASELGTLEPGKLADIILVDGDPLTYLSDMRNIRGVILNGEVVRDAEDY